MQQRYLLGVDGGGTRCRARLTDGEGRVLGEGSGGPANLTLGVNVALAELMEAAQAARRAAGLAEDIFAHAHAGLGLAGANVPELARAVEAADLPFSTWTVASDAEIACLGAFDGEDGGILILGTGSQGIAHVGGRMTTVGGWGFYLSDDASGAILGRAAIRHALKAAERLAPASPLTDAIMARFDHKPANIAHWGPTAKPSDYGSFVPLIVDHFGRGDRVATALVEAAVADATGLIDRLLDLGAGRIALMGGLAAIFRPHLPARLASCLAEPRGDALDGALLMARRRADAHISPRREATP